MTMDFDAYLKANKGKKQKTEITILTALAEQGDLSAQFKLGIAYYYGDGVPKYYEKSAEHSYNIAQYLLGAPYRKCSEASEDRKMAYMWFYVAHCNGNEKSYDMLKELESELSDDIINEMQNKGQQFVLS